MEIGVVFQSVSIIALLILLGAIVARFYPFTNDTRKMYITLITNVAMPSIILSSIFQVEFTNSMLKMMGVVFALSIAINLIGLFFGFLASVLFKQYSERRIEVAILSAFGNTGFIGIPLCAVLFGPEGALYAAIFDAGVDFTIWTVGVYLLQTKKRFSLGKLKGMINIPLMAIIIGLLVAITGIHVPVLISEMTSSLAAFAVPLAMFYIGAVVMNFQRSSVNITYFEVMIPVIVKLILLPLTVVVIVKLFPIDELLMYVIVIQSMMPALTLSSVLFAKYKRDEKMGALVTIVSTVASLLIIPLILYFMDGFI